MAEFTPGGSNQPFGKRSLCLVRLLSGAHSRPNVGDRSVCPSGQESTPMAMPAEHLYAQSRAFNSQYLWSPALVRFGSHLPGSHLPKPPRLASIPKLESMFVPPIPQTMLPRTIVPIINHFGAHVPDSKANMFAEAMRIRQCRNFGSVRCSKCNKFGLSGECCKMYYYVVIRSKKVPKIVQRQIAQTAFDTFKEAENFRVQIARKYKKIRSKRKREPPIEGTIKCQQSSESSKKSRKHESRYPTSKHLPRGALSEQEQRIKIAAESLLGLDRPVICPSSPNNLSSENAVSSDLPLTPPLAFEDSSAQKTVHQSSSPLAVVPNGFSSTAHRAMGNLAKNTKVRCVEAKAIVQAPAKTRLKASLLRAKQILPPPPYTQYLRTNYTRPIPPYQVRARHSV